METRTQQAVPRPFASRRDTLGERYDLWLIIVALILLGLGLIMIASASVSTADRELGRPLYYFWRQAGYAGLGLLLAWMVTRVELDIWRRQSPLLLVFGILLLVLVLVPGIGREVNGSTRWIPLGAVSLQPSEPMKLFLILFLAGYLVRRAEEVRSVLSGFFKPIALLTLVAGLLLLEPDYGATVVLFATALGMLFLGGVPLLSFAGWVLLIAALLGAVILAAPYRLERLAVFLDPWADPFGSGFQLTQALIAIGRGGWLGSGLGSSVQKLFYLPEAHTDFLFAVLAEELGLVGAVLVIGLFWFLCWRAFAIARRAELAERFFHAYLAYGLGLTVGLQALVNIGVNMGVLPTKGLTLPLVSYGGSSMLVNCIAIALLVRIDHELRCCAGGAGVTGAGQALPASLAPLDGVRAGR